MSEVQNLSRTFNDNINTQDGLSPEGAKRIKHQNNGMFMINCFDFHFGCRRR